MDQPTIHTLCALTHTPDTRVIVEQLCGTAVGREGLAAALAAILATLRRQASTITELSERCADLTQQHGILLHRAEAAEQRVRQVLTRWEK